MRLATQTGWEQNLQPGFRGDFLNREHHLPGGVKLDASSFAKVDGVRVTVEAVSESGSGSGAESGAEFPIGSTEITVTALTGAIPNGTILDFGSGKFVKLTAAAVAGDTTLAVEELIADLEVDDTTLYSPTTFGTRVPAGTPVFVSQTALEASSDTGIEWAYAGNGTAVQAGDTVRIVSMDVLDVVENNDANLLRKGTLLYANRMYWDTLDASVQAKIRADYEVTVGPAGQQVAAV